MPDVPENTEPEQEAAPQSLIPETLPASRDELIELEGVLLSRFEELRAADATDEAVAEMTQIGEALPRVSAAIEAIDNRAQAAKSAADAVSAYQRTREARNAPAAEAPVEEAPAEEAPAEAAAPEAPAEPAPVDNTPSEVTVPDSPADLPEPIAASRTSAAQVASSAPAPEVPASTKQESKWYTSLTAGAEIPGISAASAFSSGKQIGEAVLRRTKALEQRTGSAQAMVAQAHLDLGETLHPQENAAVVTHKMLDAVELWRADQNRESTSALTAANGFCAPTETIYDLCEPETAEGLLSLPEIAITRGGIKFFPTPDMSCFDEFTFQFDSEEVKECPEKPCPEIPCPDPIEVEPGIIGACIQAGILQMHAFPEYVERYVRGILVRHQVLISKASLQQMEDGSELVAYDAALLGCQGFTAALLNAIEIQAEDLRGEYMLGTSERLVVILPLWVRGAIRADLANRMGVDLLSVSNERISGLLSDRGVQVQWVKNWQDECVGGPGTLRAYPETVRFLIFREGAWVRGLEPIIELDTMYDSELIRFNKFTRLFTEQAIMLANLCTRSRVIELPVCPNGATHQGCDVPCFQEECTPADVDCPVAPPCPPEPAPAP